MTQGPKLNVVALASWLHSFTVEKRQVESFLKLCSRATGGRQPWASKVGEFFRIFRTLRYRFRIQTYPIFSAHLSISHLIFIHYEKASSQAWNHREMLDIKSKTYLKKKSMLPNHVIHASRLFFGYCLDVSNKISTANLSKTRGAAVAAHFHWRDSGSVEI